MARARESPPPNRISTPQGTRRAVGQSSVNSPFRQSTGSRNRITPAAIAMVESLTAGAKVLMPGMVNAPRAFSDRSSQANAVKTKITPTFRSPRLRRPKLSFSAARIAAASPASRPGG